MWLKWLPWKYIVRRAARAHGFIDPISIMMRLQQFAQPSEVAEPIELLRAGAIFHARGLINTRAIQHNLDWVWPYWVCRQFDPLDRSFLPRAYSLTHINLTHRNWTAVGIPDCQALPIVDPRGLVTPFFDGWSLDACILLDDGTTHQPSQSDQAEQVLHLDGGGLLIQTSVQFERSCLRMTAFVESESEGPVCRILYEASSQRAGYLSVALRPYNPEGISFIHDLALSQDGLWCTVNKERCIEFSEPADRFAVSDYHSGDVYHRILQRSAAHAVECDLGLATACALFRISPEKSKSVEAKVILSSDKESQPLFPSGHSQATWADALIGASVLRISDERLQFLYDSALRVLVLHSPREAFPGPFTYKRFWFRDAAFILHALLCAGLTVRVERTLDLFPSKQRVTGFFHSQDGEWDSNGEALWIFRRFCDLTGTTAKPEWRQSVLRGAQWICGKRLSDELDALHAGLMPAGFSAEHLGTNDYFYWDDFWSIAGLQSAAFMAESWGDAAHSERFWGESKLLARAVERSLERSAHRRMRHGLPASPYRRMDSGAIGSLVAGYPLQLWPGNDARLLDTALLLMDISFVKGAFFQNMIHSGLNAYLTLHIAQVLLRGGDPRFHDLMQAVADIASPTGQWPEAIHPHTGGGCMGDGQHAWAAAEWIMLMRNLFVREEEDRLIFAEGIDDRIAREGVALEYGPAPTPWGKVEVRVERRGFKTTVEWSGEWRKGQPAIEIRVPRCRPVRIQDPEISSAVVSP